MFEKEKNEAEEAARKAQWQKEQAKWTHHQREHTERCAEDIKLMTKRLENNLNQFIENDTYELEDELYNDVYAEVEKVSSEGGNSITKQIFRELVALVMTDKERETYTRYNKERHTYRGIRKRRQTIRKVFSRIMALDGDVVNGYLDILRRKDYSQYTRYRSALEKAGYIKAFNKHLRSPKTYNRNF